MDLVKKSKPVGLRTVTEWFLMPGIIISSVISSQLNWALGPILGKFFGWVVILCESVIVISTFRGKLWPFILIAGIITAKLFQVFFVGDGGESQFSYYIIFYGILMSIAGAIMMKSQLNLIYKQIYYICFINIIVMFLQTAGIADWTQFMTTHAAVELPEYPTAFFNNTSEFDISQLRPAGLLYANQYLCVIVLFAVALHFSRNEGGFRGERLILCMMVVLSMAKLTFFGFILISLIVFIIGTDYQKKSMLKGVGIVVFLLYGYKIIFPGLFEQNLKVGQIIYSALTRVTSMLYEYGNAYELVETLKDFEDIYGRETVTILTEEQLGEVGRISGYVDLIKILPFIAPIMLLGFLLYIPGLKKVKIALPRLQTLTLTCLSLVIVIPSVNSFWGNPIYLFICGFSFMPLLSIIFPKNFGLVSQGTPTRISRG